MASTWNEETSTHPNGSHNDNKQPHCHRGLLCFHGLFILLCPQSWKNSGSWTNHPGFVGFGIAKSPKKSWLMVMEPKYYGFRRWLDTLALSHHLRISTGFLGIYLKLKGVSCKYAFSRNHGPVEKWQCMKGNDSILVAVFERQPIVHWTMILGGRVTPYEVCEKWIKTTSKCTPKLLNLPDAIISNHPSRTKRNVTNQLFCWNRSCKSNYTPEN